MKRLGAIATTARKSEPGSVRRVSTRSRYCAVGGPGRIPGREPPGLGRLWAWGAGGADPGCVAAVLAQVVGLVDGVELNRRVEEREDDDHRALDQQVEPVA